MGLCTSSTIANAPLTLTARQLLAAVDERDADLTIPGQMWMPIHNRAADREDLLRAFRFTKAMKGLDIVKAAQENLVFILLPVETERLKGRSVKLSGCVGSMLPPVTHPVFTCLLFLNKDTAHRASNLLQKKGFFAADAAPPLRQLYAATFVRMTKLLEQRRRKVAPRQGAPVEPTTGSSGAVVQEAAAPAPGPCAPPHGYQRHA